MDEEHPIPSLTYRTSILLPSNMNLSEYEQKIFRLPHAQPVKAKTCEDVLYLFGKHHGVVGVMSMNRAGKIITSNFEGPLTGMYCGISKQILDTMAPTIETASARPTQINIIRINSCSQEVIIAPIAGEDLIFVVVQNPEDRPSIVSKWIPNRSDAKSQESAKDKLEMETVMAEDVPKPEAPISEK